LNNRKAIHLDGPSLAPKEKKARYDEKKFIISELPEDEQKQWSDLQESFTLHFFSSPNIMTCAELDGLVVELYHETFEDSAQDPNKFQIRAVGSFFELLLIIGTSTTRKLFHSDQTKGPQTFL